MTSILLLTEENDEYRQLLSQADCQFSEDPSEASIWVAEPAKAAEQLRQGHKPDWLASTFAGVDTLMAEDLPRSYQLTNIRGIFGPAMAEYVFAHLLSQLRQLPIYAKQQQSQQWQGYGYSTLANKTMVLLGTGSIGQSIATAAKGFGMKTLGVSLSGGPKPEFEYVFKVEDLKRALPRADVLVSTLPNTPASRHLLNRETLGLLPNHATLINVGRGQTLCLDALTYRLDNEQLSHAVLDVFEQEPLSPESPLWRHPRVTITPHIAATSFPEQITAQFIDNLERYRDGKTLLNRVDFWRGY